MHRLKLAIIHNTIAPYRHPLFEALSQQIDLIIYYCSANLSSRNWDLWPRDYNYKYKILRRIPVKTPIGDQSLNLSIVKELVSNKPQALILSDYTDPTTWLAFALARLSEIPLIYWTEGITEPQSILGKISRPLRTLFIKKSGSIIVPGRLSKNYVISLGADPEKVFIAPNSIDNKLFTQSLDKNKEYANQLTTELGVRGKVLILYVGQLIERKGVEYLLHTYEKIKKEYPNAALLVLGSGISESNLRNLANAVQLRDFRIVHSGLSLRKLSVMYSIADIFVLPTLEDIWGFVINEAMACGLPVIATKASQAAQEMIQSGENGFLVKEANSEEMYVALKILLDDATRRKEMGKKSKDIVTNRFDAENTAKGFLAATKYSVARINN